MKLTKDKAKASGRKGSRAPDKFCIEGEYVTLQEIGERIDMSACSARARLKKLRGQEGAITWAKLGVKGETELLQPTAG